MIFHTDVADSFRSIGNFPPALSNSCPDRQRDVKRDKKAKRAFLVCERFLYLWEIFLFVRDFCISESIARPDMWRGRKLLPQLYDFPLKLTKIQIAQMHIIQIQMQIIQTQMQIIQLLMHTNIKHIKSPVLRLTFVSDFLTLNYFRKLIEKLMQIVQIQIQIVQIQIQIQIVQIQIQIHTNKNASTAPVYTCDSEMTFFASEMQFLGKFTQRNVGFWSVALFLSLGWFIKACFLKSAMMKSWSELRSLVFVFPTNSPIAIWDPFVFSLFRDLIAFVSEIWSDEVPSWTARVFLLISSKTKINSVRQIIKYTSTYHHHWGPHVIVSKCHFDKIFISGQR